MTHKCVTDEQYGQLHRRTNELIRRVDEGTLFFDKTMSDLQRLIEGRASLAFVVEAWLSFYKKTFGWDVDFSDIKIPNYQEGFGRVIVVAKGLTLNQVYQACKEKFPCWTYSEDLDKQVTKNDRTPDKQSYAIRIRDRIEADEELKNLSFNNLAKKNILGITLLERILLELKYFDETGNHLDNNSITRCDGSRHSGGHVPCVRWDDDDGLGVDWCDTGDAHDDLRSREL